MAIIDRNDVSGETEYEVEVTVRTKPELTDDAVRNRAVRQARGAIFARKRNAGAVPSISSTLDVDELEVADVTELRSMPFAMRAEYRVTFIQGE